jgi:hypothetical protein
MPDSGGAPFEDEPVLSAVPAVLGAPASAPPAPGSPEEAAIIFEAMSQRPASSSRSRPKAGFVVGLAAVVAAAVVALVISATYLRHQAASGAPAQSSAPAGGASVTPAAVHLRAALSTSEAFESAHGESLQGLTADLQGAQPAVTFSALSDGVNEISVASPVAGTLVLTSLQATPRACLGILQVVSTEAAAVFTAYPVTSQAGVYYFEAPVTAGECDGLTVAPPSGGYLSASGFPTGPLP